MKHPLTRELYDYWNGRRGEEAMPERVDIDPAAIRRILADTFVLAVEPGQNPRFRVAGTKVCGLFGRELRGDDFMGLWGEADARQVREIGFKDGDLLVSTTEGGETPSVIGATEEAARISRRKPWFLYCNPDEVLHEQVARSLRVERSHAA